ncbi:MAG: hypothetical protein II797_05555, partial [Clostridia bacterium]|nr:hypothetical protein [Clostridia bacterium]
MEKETRAFYLKSFLFLFLPALAGRILRIVYSFVISDVLYADTLLPPALQYLAFAADAVLFGCAFALIPLSAALYNKRKIWV